MVGTIMVAGTFIALKAWMLAMVEALAQPIMTVATNMGTREHFLPMLLHGALKVRHSHTLAIKDITEVITPTWEIAWGNILR
mmetsp:Transcript_17788/g.36620  ORF Transcript_17788/g.36620 Transcript_17788/m.36620 type:complete len:82 (+) Transcript_17788:425-670(+)